jgi:hypothetical protein
VLNRLFLLHEGFEAKALDRISTQLKKQKAKLISSHLVARASLIGGHLSPAVILKEHNLIKTLDKEGIPKKEKIIRIFKKMRELDTTEKRLQELTGGKFIYGKSPRLSRHAIKKLERKWERQYKLT